ncbi:unnamed protein product [Kuraishia capsulata CBS 1993]|uniref:ATP-dependent RNA helicase SUV3, mitochondrial n=1 Tax=Kuraishia capsulata CBS 1993 TaxID=1382522 RepID=W6MWP3_9ASCO|nr:uncharacterized protein KUCA_T00003689001 [Kuraishia capsulata CBS 1993]CDK27710.1 unnamed protein product [Kuraishia capsulata CBS 1993]
MISRFVIRHVRGYATLKPEQEVKATLERFSQSCRTVRNAIRSRAYERLSFEPLQNMGDDFYYENESQVAKTLQKLETYVNEELPNRLKYGLNVKSVDYIFPKYDTLPSLLVGLTRQSSEQAKFDLLVNKIVYSQLKPYKLMYTFNDPRNNQNYNNDMTFNVVDTENPADWYPNARRLKRRFIMHVGPTNSGKTYHALQRLQNCKKGYYAGPLRLLAREVYEKFTSQGVKCNLVTGEEVIISVDENGSRAGLTSGTIEMIPKNRYFDCVVIDEIQMLSDESRGHSWVNAVIGVNSKEIHLCGEVSAVPLMKRIAALTGDTVEVKDYTRLGKLEVERDAVSFKTLAKGDCIVCFNKKRILDMKAYIEQQTSFRCGVIYGALPPETRAQEATKFNDGEYDILIASDAIGMGLNLKIRRVIFSTIMKFNGRRMEKLSVSQTKQIGGRAGRFGVHGEGESVGLISSFKKSDLAPIRTTMNYPVEYLSQAALWPSDKIWIRYHSMFAKGTKLRAVLKRFQKDYEKRADPENNTFFLTNIYQVTEGADFFNMSKLDENSNFSIHDQLRLMAAPIFGSLQIRSNSAGLDYLPPLMLANLFEELILAITLRLKRSLLDYSHMLPLEVTEPMGYDELKKDAANLEITYLKKLAPGRVSEIDFSTINPVLVRLKTLETMYTAVMVFLWLTYRYPQCFVDIESAQKLKELIEARISETLDMIRNETIKKNSFKF